MTKGGDAEAESSLVAEVRKLLENVHEKQMNINEAEKREPEKDKRQKSTKPFPVPFPKMTASNSAGKAVGFALGYFKVSGVGWLRWNGVGVMVGVDMARWDG